LGAIGIYSQKETKSVWFELQKNVCQWGLHLRYWSGGIKQNLLSFHCSCIWWTMENAAE
jgi:hypothetical protein